MKNYWEVSRKGKVLFTVGKPAAERSEEEIAESRAQLDQQSREWDRQRATGVPSSKVGRDLFYKEVGFLELPRVLYQNLVCWLKCVDVWYSDTGCRYEQHSMKRRS